MDEPEDIDNIDISEMSDLEVADLLEKCAENRIIKAIEEEHYYDDLMNEMMEGGPPFPFHVLPWAWFEIH